MGGGVPYFGVLIIRILLFRVLIKGSRDFGHFGVGASRREQWREHEPLGLRMMVAGCFPDPTSSLISRNESPWNLIIGAVVDILYGREYHHSAI